MAPLEESISNSQAWILFYLIGFSTLMILQNGKIYIILEALELMPHLLFFIGSSYLRKNASSELFRNIKLVVFSR